MTDARVAELVAEIDGTVNKEGALVHAWDVGDEMIVGLTANRQGYLRLAREFLHAAAAPTHGKVPTCIDVKLDYLFIRGSDLDMTIEVLERKEDLTRDKNPEPPVKRGGLKDFMGLLGCIAALLLFGIPWVMGVMSFFR